MNLSDMIDLSSPTIQNHHKEVAFISLILAEELGWSDVEQAEVFLAGSLRDIGAFSLQSKLTKLNFTCNNPREYGKIGYYLLKDFAPLKAVAEDIRYIHVNWDGGSGTEFEGQPVPIASHLVHLADRIAVLIKQDAEISDQRSEIVKLITTNSGNMFIPAMVDAFQTIAERKSFWSDLTSDSLDYLLKSKLNSTQPQIKNGSVLEIANLLRRLIDFRSKSTATHSEGVAVVAESLAQLTGFDQSELRKIRIAGYLHDLGKLAIPTEILEKPGELSADDTDIMQKHTYYSYKALEYIEGMQEINEWASWHHERLDGSGYPFHLNAEQIPTGARIIAVADYFTAITEDRPYRKGMPQREALGEMKVMADEQYLDRDQVNLLINNFDEINRIREGAQTASIDEYETFRESLNNGNGKAL
ncbi:HD domain-containing protein [bacterium]|nr:HD domain-containing protein [bacterium]